MKQQIIDFIGESLNRLFQKSPKYYIWWKIISGTVAGIATLPTILAMFHIIVPLPWTSQVDHLIAAAAYGVLFMSQIPVKNPTVTVKDVDQTGAETCTTVVNPKLPFTAKEADIVAPTVPSVKLPYSAPGDSTIPKVN